MSESMEKWDSSAARPGLPLIDATQAGLSLTKGRPVSDKNGAKPDTLLAG